MKRGDIYSTKNGDLEVRVVLNEDEVVVRFVDTDYFTLATKSNICSGRVKDRMKPSVCGVGYLGAGKYQITENGNTTIAYEKWSAMLQRCYNENSTGYKRYGAVGVSVDPVWHNFQNFAEWFDKYKFKEDGWHLDKDILVKGNVVYGPEYCCIVPRQINQAFAKCDARRGDYVIGVQYDKKNDRFIAMCQTGNGGYVRKTQLKTEYEAWLEYKAMKETMLVSLAYEWRGRVAPKVLKALVEYEVEWDD